MTMSRTKTALAVAATCGAAALGFAIWAQAARADEFKKEDLERWDKEYQGVVQKGRALWTDGKLGTNGVSCAQCHPNGANTHPETYPKFQQQLGRVAALRDMVNWCLQQPLEGTPLALDDPKMVAIESYLAWERRGVALAPGKH
jgi:thiosulfate dehydrogenase